MWQFLAPHLLDKAIDAVLTVLIVDRLLSWHEKRKWASVRELFLVHADRAISHALGVWADWLDRVAREAPATEVVSVDAGGGSATQRSLARARDANVDSIRRELRGASEPKMGFPFERKVLVGWRSAVSRFLAERSFPMGHPSWNELKSALRAPVDKLNNLVDKFSSLVDPEVAFPIMRLSLELDMLEAREHEMDLNHGPARRWVGERLASAIFFSQQLKVYVLRNRRYLNWERLDSDD